VTVATRKAGRAIKSSQLFVGALALPASHVADEEARHTVYARPPCPFRRQRNESRQVCHFIPNLEPFSHRVRQTSIGAELAVLQWRCMSKVLSREI
jgi:hypothetical protein